MDTEIMAGLARILGRVDPMPPILDDLVLLAMETKDLDAEVAKLVEDARQDVRGGPTRVLRFDAPPTTLVMSITSDTGLVRLEGWLDPAQEATITIVPRNRAAIKTRADATGRFSLDRLRPGAARLLVELADGGRFATPVLRL